MAISKNILGMNARNFLYIRSYNSPAAKRIADDKLETKKVLLEHNISTPPLLATFYDRKQIKEFDWNSLETSFVVKPARGYGGLGILVIKKWTDDIGVTVSGEEISLKQLESHISDILDGAFSLNSLPDSAFVEEMITLDPFFKKLTPVGIPDIRVIVFNMISIMAMLRLPTTESHGKANLHQGGIGIGIDIRTGITTYAYSKGKMVTRIPDTKLKTRGIKLPDWDKILLLASKAQSVIGLGYAGIDIVLDAKKGPMVLEVNSRPGLAIQNANNSSIRTRLDRVELMNVTTSERGVEVAKSLFAEAFSDKVNTGPKVLTVIEPVTLKNKEVEKTVKAKLDTGAFRTSLDITLARELGFPSTPHKVFVRSASGQKERPTVSATFYLAGKKINTVASVVDRSHMRYPMIVGRRDLNGFLINPVISDTATPIGDYDILPQAPEHEEYH